MLLLPGIFLLSWLEPASSSLLEFNRTLIEQGQWWRVLSCHWVHLSWSHAMGNAAGVLILAYVLGKDVSCRYWLLMIGWCSVIVGVGLWLMAVDLRQYVGLSGVLHGALLIAPFASSAYSQKTALVFGLVIVTKVVWEQTGLYNDMALYDVIGGRVENRAHLWGAVAGSLWVAVVMLWRTRRSGNDTSAGM